MTNAVSNVVAGRPAVTGGAYHAVLGTALPTDSTTALAAAFKALGYVGDAGVVETPTRTTDKKKAWGGDIIKVLQTDYSATYAFTLVESLNTEVLKTVHGTSNVTTTAATSTTGTLQAVKVNSAILPHEVYVFEILDGAVKVRVVIPDGQISDIGAVTYVDSDVVAYSVTVEAFYNAAAGANAVRFSTDGVTNP
jgi:hypothetical protein